MAWATPRAWAAGELVTAGNMNLYISDLLSYLKGSSGAVAIDNAMTISGQTVYHTGNLPKDVSASANTLVQRDASGHVYANHLNAPASDMTTTIPTRIAGQAGDNYYRWYNETNWLRTGMGSLGPRVSTGSYDLGQASAAGNIRRHKGVHAWTTAVTVTATGSAGILYFASIVSSVVIANGDALTFYATDDNYWEVY